MSDINPDEAKQKALALRKKHGVVNTDSAKYANVILPNLRRLAGYEDTTGAGTYTQPGDEYLFDELVDVYLHGEDEL